jgi:hypothetical protein
MNLPQKARTLFQIFVLVSAAYLFAFGITTKMVAPLQRMLLPEITVFASIAYLPHGVRVLSTWVWRWQAILPLVAASLLATLLFRSNSDIEFLSSGLVKSQLIGATCALLSFELFRLFGFSFYAGEKKALSWRNLLMVGALASFFNSIGHSLLFADLIDRDSLIYVWMIYLIGDIIGLLLCMLALMLVFRWIRLGSKNPR